MLTINGRKSHNFDLMLIVLAIIFCITELTQGNFAKAAADGFIAGLLIEVEYLKSKIPNYDK